MIKTANCTAKYSAVQNRMTGAPYVELQFLMFVFIMVLIKQSAKGKELLTNFLFTIL